MSKKSFHYFHQSDPKFYWMLLGFAILPIFLHITLLSYLMPLMNDDFVRLPNRSVFFAWQEGIAACINSYKYWNARSGECFTIFFLFSFYRQDGFHDQFANLTTGVLNGFVFVTFLLLIWLYTFGHWPHYKINKTIKAQTKLNSITIWFNLFLKFYLVFLITLTALPHIHQTVFWRTGSFNYLWGATVIMLGLLPIRFYNKFYQTHHQTNFFQNVIEAKKGFWHYGRWFLLLFFYCMALLGGAASELGGITIIFGLILWLSYQFFGRKIKIPLWLLGLVLCFLLGYIFLMTAPGGYIRFENDAFDWFRQLSFWDKLAQFPRLFIIFIGKTKWLALLTLILWVIALRQLAWKKLFILIKHGFQIRYPFIKPNALKQWDSLCNADLTFPASFYILLGLIFILGQGFNPGPAGRSYFIGAIFFLMALLLLLKKYFAADALAMLQFANFWKFFNGNKLKSSLIILFITANFYWLCYITYVVPRYHYAWQAIINLIAEQKKNGQLDVVIPSFPFFHRFFWLERLESDPNFWSNVVAARYFGVRSIRRHD